MAVQPISTFSSFSYVPTGSDIQPSGTKAKKHKDCPVDKGAAKGAIIGTVAGLAANVLLHMPKRIGEGLDESADELVKVVLPLKERLGRGLSFLGYSLKRYPLSTTGLFAVLALTGAAFAAGIGAGIGAIVKTVQNKKEEKAQKAQ